MSTFFVVMMSVACGVVIGIVVACLCWLYLLKWLFDE